jgi:myxalamid-type polyketide synthase MxaB
MPPVPAATDSFSALEAQVLSCGSTLHLAQALLQNPSSSLPRLWLVTCGAQSVGQEESLAPAQAPLWGLAHTLVLENPDLRCVRVDLDPASETIDCQALFEEISSLPPAEARIAFRKSQRYVARLVKHTGSTVNMDVRPSLTEEQPLRLEIPVRGALDNLELRPASRRQPLPGEVEIRVRATGLNFRDVLNALGMFSEEPGPLGQECAGEVVAIGEGVENVRVGDKVLGIAQGSFSTFVTTQASLVIAKPDDLSLEEAATIPITFLTAFYALHHLAKIAPGDRVLLHAAAGGVGLAAVQLAQRAGAEIFATAGNPEKRAFLQSLGVQHIMDSRSLDFAAEILAQTGGSGVDIILNSLTGDFIPKSLSVLKDKGCFLEIGKIGIWDKEQVAQLKPEAAYFVIFLGEVCQQEPALIQAMLAEVVAGLKEGSLKPLPQRIFLLQEATSAFRYMAQAKHIGKIVVTQVSQEVNEPITAKPVRADATYLITGGLGGLGLRTAQWLVAQGARYLVLVGRSDPSDSARQIVAELERQGAQIVVAKADISQQADVSRILAEIEQAMPPLRGIIHAAGVVADKIFLQQDWPGFVEVMAPKIAGAWHLHSLSRQMPLDFFVLFSSLSSVLGSPGQANYAAANAFLDALAHYRHAQGLPALSINWGPWAEVGMAARLSHQDQQRWAQQGLGMITPTDGLAALQKLILQNQPQILVALVNWSIYRQSFTHSEASLLANLVSETQSSSQSPAAQKPNLLSQLAEAPLSKQRNLVLAHVRDQAARVLGLDTSQLIDLQHPLNELGLDSLMAVELRNLLSSSVQLPLPATLLFNYPTIEALTDYLARDILSLGVTQSKVETTDAQTDALAELETLSDEEAEALLLAELTNLKGN